MDGNLKEFWDLQEVRKYDTFFQQDGALMHRENSLHNGSRAVMPPLIFYTPKSLDHNSIRPICKILKYILQYLAHFSQSVSTPIWPSKMPGMIYPSGQSSTRLTGHWSEFMLF